MRNATPVLPFKTRRPTHRRYFLSVNFRPFSFFTRTTRAKINPAHSLHEIDIQSQRLAKNVLNRVSILLSNRIQSFFSLSNGFSNYQNDDLLPIVFDCLFEVL